jgi:hypothetical protein
MAEELAIEFLRVTDVLEGAPQSMDSTYYAMDTEMPKPYAEEYELLVDNFELVSRDSPYARVDGDLVYADTEFYPILMSSSGYEDIFGFKGHWLGESVTEARATIAAERGDMMGESATDH